MADFFNLLNQNAGALTVLFTAAVAVSTIFYAILTWRLVLETRKMREVHTEPKIHVSIESYEFAINLVYLEIANIGLGPARNVSFAPSVISGGVSAQNLLADLTNSNFFEVGLRHFGPGENRRSTFTEMTKDYEGKTASVLLIKLDYESVTGRKHKDEIIVDMSEHKGVYQIGTPDLHSMATSLKSIEKNIGQMASGFKRLKVDVFSSEEREIEAENMRELRKESEKRRRTR